MFIGTAYSQETVTTVSATEIITKGKVIEGATYELAHPRGINKVGMIIGVLIILWLVLYKKEIYYLY